MVKVIKTIKGNDYFYEQHTVRVNGKPTTPSKYLGPVNPKRKKRSPLGFVIGGNLALGVAALKGELKPHKEARVKLSPHARSVEVAREQKLSLEQIQALARGAAKPAPAPTAKDDELRALLDAFNAARAAAPAGPAAPSAPAPTGESETPEAEEG